jgi:ABC-type amino acid transport substrate-binding protein
LVILFLMMAASAATARDLQDVKREGVLRHLGVPYANFVTGSGDGMDVELIRLFASSLKIRYEYVKTDFDNVFGDLTGKKVVPSGSDVRIDGDVAIRGDVAASGLTVIPWRQKVVDFSLPSFPNQVWLVARADSPIKPIKPSGKLRKDIQAVKDLLRNHTVIGKTGTCLDPALYDLKATGASIRLFSGSLNDIAPAILNGEAELTLLDVPDALVALQKWSGKIKVIGPISEKQEMAVAFAKDAPKLREAFDAFLLKCRQDGTYTRLIRKYYPFAPLYFPEFFAGMK